MEMDSLTIDDSWHEWHPTFSTTLGNLIEDGWVSWESGGLFDWSEYAYSTEVYGRLCTAIEDRYWYREIGITPPGKWRRKFLYQTKNLCRKYNRLYAIWDDLDLQQTSDKYGKSRDIGSDFPETLLSDNANYVSTGTDREYEDIEHGRVLDDIPDYIRDWVDIDKAFVDELEPLFASVITFNVNV